MKMKVIKKFCFKFTFDTEVIFMGYGEESLKMHEKWHGKIETKVRVPIESRQDLSLAYTPGVAQPCL